MRRDSEANHLDPVNPCFRLIACFHESERYRHMSEQAYLSSLGEIRFVTSSIQHS